MALSIAGCAGSSQERLSTKALVAKADAICEQLRGALNEADAQAGGATKLSSRGRLSVLFAAAEEHASNQLAKLDPPARFEQEWHQLIAGRRALIPYHHKITALASRGDLAGVESTYAAYKVVQRKMLNKFKYSPMGFKICWDIG